jgi:hypothetical protein
VAALTVSALVSAGVAIQSTGAAAAQPPAAPATAAPVHHAGTLADGATWVADVPRAWNRTVILYSHGFGPLNPQDAPDQATQKDLLNRGYALVGSSYSGPSWWALKTAADDQFGALHALEKLIGAPHRTIAWGTSMGGLVSALETQNPRGQIDGTLTTCGLVAGALNLSNYQLDGQYALSRLLAPEQKIQLVNYKTPGQAAAAAAALTRVTAKAQNTAQGRARTALAAALYNAPTWYTGDSPPAATDYAAQEAQQAAELTSFVLTFTITGRYQIELAAGGNSSFNVGVDYAALLRSSAHLKQVEALYRKAGLNLNRDLANLSHHETIKATPKAVATLARTSMVTGRIRIPELDIHTKYDQLVPVEQENWYASRVANAGDSALLRQAYTQETGHCNFQPAETIAALHALEHRLGTGQWGDSTTPADLNAAAAKTGLGTFAPYVTFTPPVLVGARSFPNHGCGDSNSVQPG